MVCGMEQGAGHGEQGDASISPALGDDAEFAPMFASFMKTMCNHGIGHKSEVEIGPSPQVNYLVIKE